MNDYNNVLNFIDTYKPHTYIYQRVIKKRFGIDGMTVHSILEKLADEGILQRVFVSLCHKCGYENDVVYTSLNQISDSDLVCDNCRSDLNVLNDVILLYRKL